MGFRDGRTARRRAACSVAAALAVLLSACGAEPEPAGDSALPRVNVLDLRSGAPVELASLTPARRPVVLWMWGPGCAICRSEATAVDRFARRHRDRIEVIGLGSHGSPESAPRFVREHDMRSMRVLWDQKSVAWAELAVPAEPVTVVLDAQGRELDRRFGPFDPERVLSVAGRA